MQVCVVSGSRADKGVLAPVATALNAKWIFVNPPETDTAANCAIWASRATSTAAQRLDAIKPDLVVLLGDRFEILGAATAAHLMNIPIAHLSGGDVTEGSQDNATRNAISKLAHIHFPTNSQSGQRLIEMKEEPWRVNVVGCPGIDSIRGYLERDELLSEEATKKWLRVDTDYYLVAYQTTTLIDDPVEEAKEVARALGGLDLPCIITSINPDYKSSEVKLVFDRISQFHRFVAMERMHFLSVMKHCKVMLGNSSSGFYEAPSFKKAFVNIGPRQRGRIEPDSVISCEAKHKEIISAVRTACILDCSEVENPYGDGHAADRIKGVIDKLPPKWDLLRKA